MPRSSARTIPANPHTSSCLKMLNMHFRHGTPHIRQRLLHPLPQKHLRITLRMITTPLLRLPDIMDHQIRQQTVQLSDADVDVGGRLGQGPETRAGEAEGHGAEDHALAAVGAEVGGVAAPARFFVDDDEEGEEFAEGGEEVGDGAVLEFVDVFWLGSLVSCILLWVGLVIGRRGK